MSSFKVNSFLRRGLLAMAVLGLCASAVTSANAACNFPNASRVGARSAVRTSAVPADVAAAMARLGGAAAQTATTNSNQGNPSIVGLWKVDVLFGGQVVDQEFDQWFSDGLELMVDTSAPATENVCQGVWKQIAPRCYQLTHPSWLFDGPSGVVTNIVVIRETVTVSANGKTFSGKGSIDLLDLDGNLLDHQDGFTLKAARIMVN